MFELHQRFIHFGKDQTSEISVPLPFSYGPFLTIFFLQSSLQKEITIYHIPSCFVGSQLSFQKSLSKKVRKWANGEMKPNRPRWLGLTWKLATLDQRSRSQYVPADFEKVTAPQFFSSDFPKSGFAEITTKLAKFSDIFVPDVANLLFS